jgi:hypothetical protein
MLWKLYSSGKCEYDESDCEVEEKAGKQSNLNRIDAHGVVVSSGGMNMELRMKKSG